MRRTALTHSIALATMVLWIATSGCHKWVPLRASPPVAGQVESGDRLRVVTVDGDVIDLARDVALEADSLVGRTDPASDDAPASRIAIALDDIETIEARRADDDATILLVAGTTGAIVGLIGLVSAATPGGGF